MGESLDVGICDNCQQRLACLAGYNLGLRAAAAEKDNNHE